MSQKHKVVLITADQRRHRYVATEIDQRMSLAGIVSEEKRKAVSDNKKRASREEEIIEEHFSRREEAEKKHLGDCRMPEGPDLLEMKKGGANSEEAFEWIKAREPEAILLYGASIIRDPLLSAYSGQVVNLHLGLSPYYRGAGTNFWPLVDGKPELVGATIHLATDEVDAGPILSQVRPPVKKGDRAHDLGTRTIQAGVKEMAKAVNAYLDGAIEPVEQNTNRGKEFARSDFNAEDVEVLWENIENGMIEKFRTRQTKRAQSYPIIKMGETYP